MNNEGNKKMHIRRKRIIHTPSLNICLSVIQQFCCLWILAGDALNLNFPYSGQCGSHGLKIPFMKNIGYLREATTSKLRTADTLRVPTALSRTILPLNSEHSAATSLKLSGASPSENEKLIVSRQHKALVHKFVSSP